MRRIALPLLLLSSLLAGQEFKVGSKIHDFTVQDLKGASVPVSFQSGTISVVTFIATQCPVSNAYNDRMSAIYKDYSSKGVHFIFVNANRTESGQEVAQHAKSVGFPFPVYKDPNNELADRFDAQVTPESYVIDKTGTIVYHGKVDDSQNEARVRQQSLRQALDAVMAGNPVPVKETKAFGCTIKRVRRSS